MVKVPFQLLSHELSALPVIVGCCNLELVLRSSSDHINSGSLKILAAQLSGDNQKVPHVATFLNKWQVSNPLGYKLRHRQDSPLAGNKPPLNFAILGNCIQSIAQVSRS